MAYIIPTNNIFCLEIIRPPSPPVGSAVAPAAHRGPRGAAGRAARQDPEQFVFQVSKWKFWDFFVQLCFCLMAQPLV